MKKLILIDGNNLMFRSYFATAYTGNMMKNSKGFPTNALYGFITMLNKIIVEEKPTYMVVAFDIGKNFRTDKYKDYKAGRLEMPFELKSQMEIVRDLLDALGICHMEVDNYEADDIIGTLSKIALEDPLFDATIISSDKDLLQLINKEIDVKLLKQKGFIRYNEKTFYDDYGFEPIHIIDLKALAGDHSDNIPGVKGVGEKTALTLIQKYKTIEELYENIEDIKGKLKEKLINDKENAFFSKDLATIYNEVPIDNDLEKTIIRKQDNEKLQTIYEDLEFYSFMKENIKNKERINKKIIEIENIEELKVENICSFYIECDEENYHKGKILGMAICTKDIIYYIKNELVEKAIDKIDSVLKYTFDNKKNIVLLDNKTINNVNFDLMIAAYLLNNNIKNDDLAYLMNNNDYEVMFYDVAKKSDFEDIKKMVVSKAEYIFDTRDDYIKRLKLESMFELMMDIEMPLISVLADMEYNGIKVDKNILNEMKDTYEAKIDICTKEICDMAGVNFNVSSPKQLSDVLFNVMKLPYPNKKDKTYSTDNKILIKLLRVHPIIEKIVEYRNITKIYSTYLEGLENAIYPDGKIHTIYKQNLTRTGRLSSVEPNMQNIPTRDEEGRKIRKAFIPCNDIFVSADYSQIELRILAHISNSKELIDAFKEGKDIHTAVASDIFGVMEKDVTKKQRRTAKAVIFGIVYGISGFGLGENLEISTTEASGLIQKYFDLYPSVKVYMDNIINEAKEQGYVRTLFNRKRNIDELTSNVYAIRNAGERIALNTPIQGTGADILKMAMIKINEAFRKENLKSKMLLQVHDELVFDVIDNEKDKIEKLIKEIMENIYDLKAPLKVEIDFGVNWYEAK